MNSYMFSKFIIVVDLFVTCFVLLAIQKVISIPNRITLDISNYPLILHLDYNEEGVSIDSYVLDNDDVFVKVIDGDELIWEAEDGGFSNNIIIQKDIDENRLLTIRIPIENGNIHIKYRRENDSNSWTLHHDGINDNPALNTIIDINNYDNGINHIKRTHYGNMVVKHRINIYQFLIRVIDGGYILWQRLEGSSDHCVRCTLYIRRGVLKYIFLGLVIGGNLRSMCYQKNNDNSISSIQVDDFISKTNRLIGELRIDINSLEVHEGFTIRVLGMSLGLPCRLYIAHYDSTIKEVFDDDQLIWSNNEDEDEYISVVTVSLKDNISRLLMLDIHRGAHHAYIYFKRLYIGNWIQITHNMYYSLQQRISHERSIDIYEDDPVLNTTVIYKPSGNAIKLSLITSPLIVVAKILDNNIVIWDGRYVSDVVGIIRHIRHQQIILLLLQITDDDPNPKDLYYKIQFDGSWLTIDADVYKILSDKLDNEIIIDVNNIIERENTIITNHTIYGCNAHTISILNDIWVSQIKDGDRMIWIGEEWDKYNERKCKYVVIHSDNTGPLLVEVNEQTSEPSDGNLYFMKLDDGNWIQVTKEEFYIKLEEYDQKEYENTQLN